MPVPMPMPANDPMLDVSLQLSVSDGTRRFELDVAFASTSRLTALYGPSGAGKSLTLQAMAGLLRPDAGRVVVRGHTLFDAAAGIDVPADRRGVGYLFQHYALFPHLSVRDNVAFGLGDWLRRAPKAEVRDRVDRLLETFELTALARSRPRTLSGGQQQRVALARALACEPRLLLLDEPFAALNPVLRRTLRQELAEVVARWDIPAVIITHDVEDVLALAQTAYVIDAGKVVQAVDVATGERHEVVRRVLTPSLAADDPEQALRVQALLAALAPG